MDIADLKAFARVADLGSITAAARALGVPKSSVSRGLARVERETRSTLVERSTRQLRLTTAGKLFRDHVGRALDELESGRDAVAELQNKIVGEMRVDAPYAFAQYAIAPMLPSFLQAHPDLRIRLSVTNERIDPIAEDVDAVVRLGATRATGLVTRKLLSFDDWLCASPTYLERAGFPKTIEEIAGHDVVATSQPVRWLPTGLTSSDLRSCLVVPEPATTLSLLLAHGGIGCLPSFLVIDAVAEGLLDRVLPEHVFGRHDISLVSPSRTRLARLRPFTDALVASLSRSRVDTDSK